MTADSKRVWRSIDAHRLSAYESHLETCPICSDDKLCNEGMDLAGALADPVPGRDVNQLKVIR